MVSSERILIVCALKEEFEAPNLRVIYTGMGKIKALLGVSEVDVNSYDLIINLGSCGSFNIHPKTLVRVSYFQEWDRIIPKGFEKGREVLRESFQQINKIKLPYKEVVCCSGDTFVTEEMSTLQPAVETVFDMEAFALKAYALKHGKKFLCLKYVTDSGAENEWVNNLENAQTAFKEALERLEVY